MWIALTGNLSGVMLDFYSATAVHENGAVIYPAAAYLNIFYLLAIAAALGLRCVSLVPETHGNNIWRKK